jgi:hypothetical protein
MKTVIDDLIENLKRIRPETILSRSVSSSDLQAAADINREQLRQGELSSGESLNNYSKSTEGYNESRSTKVTSSEKIKFYDTGGMYKTIKGSITKDGQLALKSSSKKTALSQDYVKDKGYEGNVLGLQEEWASKWFETLVKDNFLKMLKDRILTQ